MSMPPPLPDVVPPPSAPPSAAQRAGWRQRHWRWAVPLLSVVCFALLAVLVYGFITVLGAAMRDNDAYRIAMAQAAADPRLAEAIGTPIEHDGFMTGSVTSGARSHASLQIPVSGPRGEATVYVEAGSQLGVWRFEVLSVTVDGAESSIDLLPSLPANRRMGQTAPGGPPEDAAAAEPAGEGGDAP